MTTSATPQPTVRAVFTALIDYAGLFPPARLSMKEAVAEYAAEKQGRYAWMLGRFIVQHSWVTHLVEAIEKGGRFAVSMILDSGPAVLEEVARIRACESSLSVEALEVVLAPEQIDAFPPVVRDAGLADLPSYVEFRRDANWERVVPCVMAALAASGLGAKIRCGGVDAAAFPTPSEVALFIYWACRYNVPFKATAGLHHPIRHFDAATGAKMHGFLNLLTATALARAGLSVDELVEPLASEDGAQFHLDDRGLQFGDRRIGVSELEAMRRESFAGYGSCSFSEPVDDLRAMNLLS